MRFKGMTLEGFMGELASAAPTPGGGTAAAVASAMAAALVAMAAAVSLRKDPDNEGLAATCRRAEELKERLFVLADRDAAAYGKVVEAYRLPKTTEKEKRARKARIQEALRAAAEVPLETAALAAEVLATAIAAADKVRTSVLSDVLVAVRLAHAGLHGALYNVDVNRAYLDDEGIKRELEKRRNALEERADALMGKLSSLEANLRR